MGEIKFRAMPKEEFNNREIVLDSMAYYSQETEYDGTFVYGYLADGYIIGETIDADEDYYNPMFWIPIEKETVGQYTGQVDRKGRKIYVGDFVEGGYTNPMTGKYVKRIYLIESIDTGFKGKLIGHSPYGDIFLSWIGKHENFNREVIGNKYSNPELLEVKHENS